jgi:uncharacterized protein
MKKYVLSLLFLCLCVAALSQTGSMPPGHQMLADPEKFADGHVAALDQQVQLTAEQKPKLSALFLAEGKQLFALLNDPKLTPEQKQMGIENLHQQTAARVSSMLTAEQRRRAAPPEERPVPAHSSQT